MFLKAGWVAAEFAGHQREHHSQSPPVLQPFHRARPQLVQGQSLTFNSDPSLLAPLCRPLNPSCDGRRSSQRWCVTRKTSHAGQLPFDQTWLVAVKYTLLTYVCFFFCFFSLLVIRACIRRLKWWKSWERFSCFSSTQRWRLHRCHVFLLVMPLHFFFAFKLS